MKSLGLSGKAWLGHNMSNAIKVRVFNITDLEQVLKLFYETVHTVNASDYSQEQRDAWAPKNLDRKRWKTMLLTSYTYVVEQGNQILGFGSLTTNGTLDHIFVHKDHQGQGVGKLLLATLEGKAREQNLREITTEASITAQPFFLENGYAVVKQQEKVVHNVAMPNVVMKKEL